MRWKSRLFGAVGGSAIMKSLSATLLLAAMLMALGSVNPAHANPATTGNISTITASSFVQGTAATWTITFVPSHDIHPGNTIYIRYNWVKDFFDMKEIPFPNTTGSYSINGTMPFYVSTSIGQIAIQSDVPLMANQTMVLQINNVITPDFSGATPIPFWMYSSVNPSYSGTYSFPVTPPLPATPTNLTASAVGADNVQLSWDTVADATGYNIYQDGHKLNMASVTSGSYTVGGLSYSSPYGFAVSALNAGGESARTAPLNVTTMLPFKVGLGAVDGNAGDTVTLPFTLENESTLGITAVQFDLEIDAMFLDNAVFIDGSTGMQVNRISEEPRIYRVLIGDVGVTALPEALGAVELDLSPGLNYLESSWVNLTNIVVVDSNDRSISLPDTSAEVTVIDTLAPELTLSLSTDQYAESVNVLITGDGTGSNIAAYKWARGVYEAEWFEAGGGAAVISGNSFTVGGAAVDNSTVTVYAVDEAGNHTVETIVVDNAVRKGDANGDGLVDLLDWQLTANYILLKETPDARQQFAADMNGDGAINVADWVLIARRLVAV